MTALSSRQEAVVTTQVIIILCKTVQTAMITALNGLRRLWPLMMAKCKKLFGLQNLVTKHTTL